MTQLTGEEGGRWWVITREGKELFDFDRGTITSFFGHVLQPASRGHRALIAGIGACTVGERGEWALHDGPPDAPTGHWLIYTTPIERIVRIPDHTTAEDPR